MPPRSDEPPRRAPQARRGASRDVPPADDQETPEERAFGGIGDARAYTPRGRTVAERDQRTRSPHAGRTTDPFRPALQVLDGGEPAGRARRRDADDPEPPAARRTRDDAEPAPARRRRDDAARRGADDAEPPAARRRTEPKMPAARRAADPATQKTPKVRRGRKPATEP